MFGAHSIKAGNRVKFFTNVKRKKGCFWWYWNLLNNDFFHNEEISKKNPMEFFEDRVLYHADIPFIVKAKLDMYKHI